MGSPNPAVGPVSDQPHPASDRSLLERFAAAGDGEAFALVVQRHAALVYRVCGRVLGRHPDAEDVFQATFLILARKAGVVAWRDSVGPWLHKVAHRLALEVKAAAARRHRRDREAGLRRWTGAGGGPDPELARVMEEELARLPNTLRAPLVLCYLEGVPREEAARLLGQSLATLKRRLEQGRERLRARLIRRGWAVSGLGLAALLAPAPGAAAPPADLVAAAGSPGGIVSPRVADLATRAGSGPIPSGLTLTGIGGGLAALGVLLALLLDWPRPPVDTLPPPPPAVPPPAAEVGLPPGWEAALGKQAPWNQFLGTLVPPPIVIGPRGSGFLIPWEKFFFSFRDATTGLERWREPVELGFPVGTVGTVAFSADGTLLAVVHPPKFRPGEPRRVTVVVWEAATGRCQARWTVPGGRVTALFFTPDGRQLFLEGGWDKDQQGVSAWDTATGRQLGGWAQDGVLKGVTAAGHPVLYAAPDERPRLFVRQFGPDWPQGRELQRWDLPHATWHARVSTSGTTMITWQDHLHFLGSLKVYDLTTGALRFQKAELQTSRGRLALSPSGHRVAVGQGATVQVWDTITGRRVAAHILSEDGVFRDCLGLTFDGEDRLVSVHARREGPPLCLVDVATATEVVQVPSGAPP